MILLIDNYDSFSYNLYQYIGEISSDIKVIRNDEITVEEIRALRPDCIILSPGPGRPEDAGIIVEETLVARYHSLAAERDTIPECLKITALTTDGEVMAVQHREYPIYGVQFHPESIMTPDGKRMIQNFIGSSQKTIR